MQVKIETNYQRLPEKFFSVWIYNSENEPFFSNVPDTVKPYIDEFLKISKKEKKPKHSLSYTSVNKKAIHGGIICSLKNVSYYDKNEKIKITAGKAYDKGADSESDAIVFHIDGEKGIESAASVIEGALIKSYKFDKYKSAEKSKSPEIIVFADKKDEAKLKKTIGEKIILCEALSNARDIINDTSRVVTPQYIAERAKELAKKNNFKCEVFDEKRLKKEGYNGLITVGRGSSNPPRMIVLSYSPAKPKTKDHLCLIGKGLTFDSGGICLKQASGMWQMKCDMAGAGAVLYAMDAIAKLKPAVKITMIITTAENAIDANATYPNEIFKAKNGKFVHVENTDAEGRLAMSDGLCYAGLIKATHIIDVATLTGSIVTALGTSIAGIFGNDAEFLNKLKASGENAGDALHIMPLYEEYKDLIKHKIADLNNIGSTTKGGAITAALFLREFVPAKTKWIHMDIAGVDSADSVWKYYNFGATGIPLRTLVDLIMRWNEKQE